VEGERKSEGGRGRKARKRDGKKTIQKLIAAAAALVVNDLRIRGQKGEEICNVRQRAEFVEVGHLQSAQQTAESTVRETKAARVQLG
jgi:hypothetical protein